MKYRNFLNDTYFAITKYGKKDKTLYIFHTEKPSRYKLAYHLIPFKKVDFTIAIINNELQFFDLTLNSEVNIYEKISELYLINLHGCFYIKSKDKINYIVYPELRNNEKFTFVNDNSLFLDLHKFNVVKIVINNPEKQDIDRLQLGYYEECKNTKNISILPLKEIKVWSFDKKRTINYTL